MSIPGFNVNLVLVLLGLILGILSGLIPGLHSNTILSFMSSFGLEQEDFSILVLMILPLHLIFSFIPSIFFGIPEHGTVLTILPGQRMVLQGKGLVALKVVILSSLIAALLSIAFSYPALFMFPFLYSLIKPYIGQVLVVFSLLFLIRTKEPVISCIVFLAAGMLGVYSLHIDMADNFLPLFSGMFAMAAILNYEKFKIPEQKDESVDFGFIKFTVFGVIAGFFADLLPGIGSPSQVATFITIFMPINTLGYLAAIASISMSEAIFSFATSASIGKSRMGATAMLSEQINIADNLLFVLCLFLFALAIAVALVYLLRKYIGKLALLDFSQFNILLAVYLLSLVFVIDGFVGLIVFVLSSILGFVTVKLGIERTTLMGAVIVPTILLIFKIFVF